MIYYVNGEPHDSDYLEHSGVKGMKWGVRRFQNPDGSLTAEGRIRYGRGEGKRKNLIQRLAASHKKRVKAKNAARLEAEADEKRLPEKAKGSWTNDELKSKIERAKLEKEYNELVKKPPKEMSKGKEMLLKALPEVAKNVLQTYIQTSLQSQKELAKDQMKYADEAKKRSEKRKDDAAKQAAAEKRKEEERKREPNRELKENVEKAKLEYELEELEKKKKKLRDDD